MCFNIATFVYAPIFMPTILNFVGVRGLTFTFLGLGEIFSVVFVLIGLGSLDAVDSLPDIQLTHRDCSTVKRYDRV